MCPDPFNKIVDVMAGAMWLTLFICALIAVFQSLPFILSWSGPALIIWTSLILLCYIFAPRHAVSMGIPYFYQSRYKKWKTGRDDWDTRILRGVDKQ